MSSSQKIILITGSNTGIGYATAAELLKQPTNHVILCSRSVEKGEAAVAELKKATPEASLSLVQLDITDEASISAAAAKVTQEFGRLDVLVNNAGVVSRKPSVLEQFRETFEANVFGPTLVTKAFTPLLLKSSAPRIVYISSGAGSIAKKQDPANPFAKRDFRVYGSSKTALNMIMMHDHVEHGPNGVKVFSYCPGYVISDLTGKEDREMRKKNGASTAEEAAKHVVRVVIGERDDEAGKFLHKDGTYDF